MKIPRRLISYKQLRIICQSAGNSNTLLLTTAFQEWKTALIGLLLITPLNIAKSGYAISNWTANNWKLITVTGLLMAAGKGVQETSRVAIEGTDVMYNAFISPTIQALKLLLNLARLMFDAFVPLWNASMWVLRTVPTLSLIHL